VYVEESESAKYELIPSVNIIYYRTATDTLSTNSVDVKIGVQTFHGNYEITSQSLLDEKGLGAYYAIDGVFENAVKLNISPVALLQLENGSAILATESGNGLSLEGDNIDVASIKDNITLYLIDEATNAELAKYIIPVTKDGQQGDKGADGAGYSVYVDTPIISHPIDPKTKATIGSGTYQVEVQVLNNGTPLATENIVPIYSFDGVGVEATFVQNEKSYTFTISIPADLSEERRAKRIELQFYGKEGYEFPSGDIRGNIAIAYLERGMVGPQANDGPLLYPCGYWNNETEFKLTYEQDANGNIVVGENGEAKVVAKPLVYHEAIKTYFVLEAPASKGDDPRNETIVDGKLVWKPFQNLGYVIADAMMAKWAHFGGENGAVFWGDYMFSSKGVNDNGEEVDYAAYADSNMFGEDGKLTGKVIPNYFVDFATGAAKCNMMSEPLTPMEAGTFVHVINPMRGHNLTIRSEKAIIGTDGGNRPKPCYPKMVFLPEVKNDDPYYDGLRCTIIAESVPNVDVKTGYSWGDSGDDMSIGHEVILICADSRLATLTEPVNETMDDYMFCVGGRIAKFIVMEAGSMLHLRCCMAQFRENENVFTKPIWYVENSSDFEPTNLKVVVESEENTIHTFVCNYHSWQEQGRYIAVATKYIESVRNGASQMLSFTYLNYENKMNYGSVVIFDGLTEE
jgi:hypothetical protein